MAGLNLITGTGNQTVEELKRAVSGLDPSTITGLVNNVETLQTEMTTAQNNITQLDTDYQNIDARVGVLENSQGSSGGTYTSLTPSVSKSDTRTRIWVSNVSKETSYTTKLCSMFLFKQINLDTPTTENVKVNIITYGGQGPNNGMTLYGYSGATLNNSALKERNNINPYFTIPTGVSAFTVSFKVNDLGADIFVSYYNAEGVAIKSETISLYCNTTNLKTNVGIKYEATGLEITSSHTFTTSGSLVSDNSKTN